MCGGRALIYSVNRSVRSVSAFTHKIQFITEWGMQPTPEWFDHFVELHYSWYRNRTPLGTERGIFSLLAIKQGARVLELCCGDGFNAHHFYSVRATSVLSVDLDPLAIKHARKNFKADNVRYEVADIRTDMPVATFDNVIWDAAIEHFTPAEIDSILKKITAVLAEGGVLSGYTIVEAAVKAHSDHEYEFKSREDLESFIKPHFRHVRVFETVYPLRHNLYFFASDNPSNLPL